MRIVFTLILAIFLQSNLYSQGCCSGSTGNPIVGGAAAGVLQKYQMEVSSSFQSNSSNKFLSGTKDTVGMIYEKLGSNYLFFRTDYGLTDKLTLSFASGYFLDKTLTKLGDENRLSTKGISDIILLPRYNIFNKSTKQHRTELTLGIGAKIPVGSHTDSVHVYADVWDLKPPTIQLSTGGVDKMFYSFFFREYKKQRFRVFTNTMYIQRGYNSLNEKFGNYVSISAFAGKSYRNWSFTTQLKIEYIGQLQATPQKLIDLSENSFDLISWQEKQSSTGSDKLFFVPQLGYSKNGITIFATTDIPLYQNLNGLQVSSQKQFAIGINYRFLTKDCSSELQ
jgi:hypothetical protein